MPAQTATAARPRARGRRRHPPPSQPAVRNTTALLTRNGVWAFLAFAAAVLVAFWPSYFSRLADQPTFRAHAHGIAMSLWCALLIAQAWLVRTNRRPLHRTLGRASWVLVPLIVLATVTFVHFRLQGAGSLGSRELHSLALMLNATVVFAVIYGLAMYHRRTPATHARYMLCTIFPLFTPVTDRIIFRHVPGLVPLVPRIDGSPVVPFAGFLLADVILAALWAWDWQSGRRSPAFPVALAILVAYHVTVMTFHGLPAWRAFGEWFVALPLS